MILDVPVHRPLPGEKADIWYDGGNYAYENQNTTILNQAYVSVSLSSLGFSADATHQEAS